jgi:hypothetical protein
MLGKKTYGTRPSSIGSHTSVMLIELMAVSWCNLGILFCFRTWIDNYFTREERRDRERGLRDILKSIPTFKISAIATVLLIACPIAFKTISLTRFS